MFAEFYTYIINGLLALGILGIIASLVLNFFPVINAYKLPVQLISVVLLVFAIYEKGKIAKELEIKILKAEYEVKLAEANARSAVVTKEIVTKVVTQKQIVKEKGEDVIRYVNVQPEIEKFDKTCPLPQAAVTAHNAAATQNTELLQTSVKELDPNANINVEKINEAAKGKLLLAPKK